MHFTIIDWAIILIYLLGTLVAGLQGRKYISGVSDFLVAGRELGTFVSIGTLAATEIGTVTFMYYAELGYRTGFASFINGLIAAIVMISIGRTGFVVRRLRELRLMTMPEYFEARYSRNLRVLTGILVATGGILNMGVFLKVEGTFLVLISGIPLNYLKEAMTAILLLELIYTVLGGMVSIVITDFIQYVALSIGTVIVTLYSIHVVGWGNMYATVATTMGAQGFSPILNPEYGWTYMIFLTLSCLAGDTCWQTIAMRTFSTRDSETSRKVFLWTGFIYLGRGMMPMLWGIAALAMLGPHLNSLEAMPMMLSKILPAGVLGLVVAGMLAATMSVNSSYLLGWSSIVAQDIVLPLRREPLSSRAQVLLNRATNIFVSLFVLFWGLWYKLPGPAYFYLTITATIFLGGTFAAVIAGLYWKRANARGAYFAMIAGALGAVGFFFFHVSTGWAGIGSFGLAGLGMFVGSLLGKKGTSPPPGVRLESTQSATTLG
jgi:SSS family solute:Na+ symporter